MFVRARKEDQQDHSLYPSNCIGEFDCEGKDKVVDKNDNPSTTDLCGCNGEKKNEEANARMLAMLPYLPTSIRCVELPSFLIEIETEVVVC